jgi:hypothetical protein
MVTLRVVSLVLVALGLMILGADLIGWVETDSFDPHSIIGLWKAINPSSAAAAEAWAGGLPDPVNRGALAFLHAWSFLIVGLPGVILAMFAAQK